jgi:hypothetical protein
MIQGASFFVILSAAKNPLGQRFHAGPSRTGFFAALRMTDMLKTFPRRTLNPGKFFGELSHE